MSELTQPPKCYFRQILEKVAAITEANTTLQSYFGWEPVPEAPLLDWAGRRRVFLDYGDGVSSKISPQLTITETTRRMAFELLGDSGEMPSQLEGTICIVVSLYVDENVPDSEGQLGEAEKLLSGDLLDAVVQFLRSNVVDKDGLWSDVTMPMPVVFDRAKGLRRCYAFMDFTAQAKVTTAIPIPTLIY